jgi:predicted porin
MNKKLIAAAIAAAMVAPAAYAQATLYGKFHTSIDSNDQDAYNEDNWEVNSRASRLGVKGSEDLGGGLKAIYQLEVGFNSSGETDGQGGGNVFGSKTRNTFVGLSGGFGTFLVGRHDTPAKVAFYAAGTERLGDSVIDLNLGNNLSAEPSSLSPIGVFHEYRANDAIAYLSPNFSGFTFAGAIIPGEDCDKDVTEGGPDPLCGDRDGIADHWSVGLMYAGGGLKASVGYSKYDVDDGTASVDLDFFEHLPPLIIDPGSGGLQLVETDDYEVLQAGVSYTWNNWSIGGHYETTDNAGGIKDADYDAFAITGKATFGNNAISLVYTDGSLEPDSYAGLDNDVDIGGWGIAGEHNFSKRTKVYAAYASGEFEYGDNYASSDDDNDVFSLGMIHNF